MCFQPNQLQLHSLFFPSLVSLYQFIINFLYYLIFSRLFFAGAKRDKSKIDEMKKNDKFFEMKFNRGRWALPHNPPKVNSIEPPLVWFIGLRPHQFIHQSSSQRMIEGMNCGLAAELLAPWGGVLRFRKREAAALLHSINFINFIAQLPSLFLQLNHSQINGVG